MNIFAEVKEHLTAKQVAEYYGLKVGRNGMACCPFHDDHHPSMKIDKNYHCFACGVGGDAIDYAARMYGLSQYDAARKMIEDFGLPIAIGSKVEVNYREKNRICKEREERERIIHIQKRFEKWCRQNIERLRLSLDEIEKTNRFLIGKPPDVVFSEEYTQMLHAQPMMEYWLDVLCMGNIEDKKELFLKNRKEIDELAGCVRTAGVGIMEQNRRGA